ncbi:MAG TPA: type II toxin-antitoxin system VapC family toxin [Candidatus Saccharimonadales bacterium]|nr:type II toxin-antitoxin system VapC family toxin [Candidatus Saccharimonadales bacterium]
MKLLLDTNVLIWLISSSESRSLGAKAKQVIKAAEMVYVSPVSVLEIRIKALLGKLVAGDIVNDIELAGLKSLDFGMEAADAVRDFPGLSKHDPFDRMLVAQARVEGLSLLTSDSFLLDQGFDFVVSARG